METEVLAQWHHLDCHHHHQAEQGGYETIYQTDRGPCQGGDTTNPAKFVAKLMSFISQVDSTKEGWHRYYIQAMKRSFGFGASLF